VRQSGGDAPSISIPYRSTLKKLQAQWVGPTPKAITGSAELIPDRNLISGRLTNNTGRDLHEVYFAFKYRTGQDYVYYLRTWENGAVLDLGRHLNLNDDDTSAAIVGIDGAAPDRNRKLRGHLQLQWAPFWTDPMRGANITNSFFNDTQRAFPILSLFDRLPPVRNLTPDRRDRVELLRSGARQLDLSAALNAGALLILATARQEPLPFELSIQGDTVTGEGTSFYQFVLPLDRSALRDDGAEQATQEQQ
jgi:hypothetical protein